MRSKSDNPLPCLRGVRLNPAVAGVLHDDEIPIDTGLVRALVDRAMPHHVGLPVRRLDSGGSSNALFRFGEDLLVRLPRQPGGSAAIVKEARWLPVLGALLPVDVPEVVAVFEPGGDYPERWSVVRWIDGEHPEVVTPEMPAGPRRGTWQRALPRWCMSWGWHRCLARRPAIGACAGTGVSRSRLWTWWPGRTLSVAGHWVTSRSALTPPDGCGTKL